MVPLQLVGTQVPVAENEVAKEVEPLKLKILELESKIKQLESGFYSGMKALTTEFILQMTCSNDYVN